MPAFKPMARPILFQFLLVAGLLLMISTGARCQVYVDPIFTPANMNGNGSSFVSLPGFEEYTWKGWCRIYTDPCAPRVKLENMLEGTFFNSSSPGDPPSKVTWSMEGHAHVGPCSNPGGHWQQNKSMPVSTWVESNELWLPLQPPATFAVQTYFAKQVKSGDKPGSFVYHHPDTRKMACCQYDYVSSDAWPRCSAGSRVGAGWWLSTSALVLFLFFMDAPISFSCMAWSWLAN